MTAFLSSAHHSGQASIIWSVTLPHTLFLSFVPVTHLFSLIQANATSSHIHSRAANLLVEKTRHAHK